MYPCQKLLELHEHLQGPFLCPPSAAGDMQIDASYRAKGKFRQESFNFLELPWDSGPRMLSRHGLRHSEEELVQQISLRIFSLTAENNASIAFQDIREEGTAVFQAGKVMYVQQVTMRTHKSKKGGAHM